MTSFERRVQKLSCEEVDHDNKPIIMICFNKDCAKRKVCLTCIDKFHSAHKGELASIEDVEDFIKNNCIKQKGAFQCNSILQQFDDFKKEIINQLNVIEFILKEKVKQMFEEMNNTAQKFQQDGDDQYENELNTMKDNCRGKIDDLKLIWSGKITEFKNTILPIEINLKRLEKECQPSLELTSKLTHVNLLYPKVNLKLKHLYLSQLDTDSQAKISQLEFTLCKNMNLTEIIHEWKVEIKHEQAKIVNNCYEIDFPENVFLKQGECYSLQLKCQENTTFQQFCDYALENELLGFQQSDYEQANFKKNEDYQIYSQSNKGIFSSIKVLIE